MITDLSDTSLPNVPLWTETFSYEHIFSLGNAGRLSAEGNVFFASGHNVDLSPYDTDRYQEACHLLNARLLYMPQNGNWTRGAYGNNLGNEAVRTRTFDPNPNATHLFIDAPRTFGATLSVKF